MADLQRRIKKHWFPPKGNESKRVMVVFKVHSGGELSDLRIDHSSGVQIADKAALDSVQNAAPFRPLPAGAPDAVDIQFTFDYNVFNGGGHGTFRQF
jgi:TonB family protein